VRARLQLARWSGGLIRRVRAGRIRPPAGSALAVVAAARDTAGKLLRVRGGGDGAAQRGAPDGGGRLVRAVRRRGAGGAPEWRARIAGGDAAALDAFVQEVRRLYPFVPVLAARARRAQDVLGVPVPRGGLVVLDVHGTTHDPQHWPDPDRFDPDRFLRGPMDADALVPQGGGDVATGHRCPGEGVTLTMLAVAVRAMAGQPRSFPPQDLGYDLARIPTRPRSGVVMDGSAG
jgi:fatty-acid peroxygenase